MYITIAVADFQHEDWQSAFFPADLPDDWRFDYYANEYNSLLLNASDVQRIGEASINEMIAEAAESFLFVLPEAVHINDADAVCGIITIDFAEGEQDCTLENLSIEKAKIIKQQDLSETVYVLRVNSVSLIENNQIKQLLMHIHSNYSDVDRVCLFIGQKLQDVELLSTANIINDLL